MSDRDEFDRLVEGLELEFASSFPDEPGDPEELFDPAWEPAEDRPVEDVPEPEPFYRRVEPVPVAPRRRSVLLAWVGVLGAPLALVVATVSGVFLDRAIVACAALIFVAAAIYLFSQLPEHGPSRRDWPDDGAVL